MTKDDGTMPVAVVLAQVLRAGPTDDMQAALLMCDGVLQGQRTGFTVLVPLLCVPNVTTALITSQAIAHAQQATAPGQPATHPALAAEQATASASPSTIPSESGAVVVSLQLNGAWLHAQLSQQTAQQLRDALTAAMARH